MESDCGGALSQAKEDGPDRGTCGQGSQRLEVSHPASGNSLKLNPSIFSLIKLILMPTIRKDGRVFARMKIYYGALAADSGISREALSRDQISSTSSPRNTKTMGASLSLDQYVKEVFAEVGIGEEFVEPFVAALRQRHANLETGSDLLLLDLSVVGFNRTSKVRQSAVF